MKILEALRAHRRAVDVAALLACVLMFGYALYVQQHLGLEPCPLCIFQRIAVMGLALSFLLAVLVPNGWRAPRVAVALLIGAVALAGAGVSARHVYIQSLPPGKVPVCGATLDYMWEVFPVMQVLRKVLTGSGECAKIDWTLFGLSMPWWVMFCVLGLGTVGVLANWPAARRRGWG